MQPPSLSLGLRSPHSLDQELVEKDSVQGIQPWPEPWKKQGARPTVCSVWLNKKMRDERLLGKQQHNTSSPFKKTASWDCDLLQMPRQFSLGSFAGTSVPYSFKCLKRWWQTTWQCSEHSRWTHPFLEGPYMTYLGYQSCTASAESAQATDKKACHSSEHKKVKHTCHAGTRAV